MIYRVATAADVQQLFDVRMSVSENVLINTSLVTDEICINYLTQRGKGWLCAIGDRVVGFAIADLKDDSIWALFVRPEHEGKGIGGALHNMMLDWYFAQNKDQVWLSTEAGTKAEQFYRKRGWQETGTKHNEIRFELTAVAYNMHSRGR